MNMSSNKKFEEDYQKAYKAYQEKYNNLPMEVREQTVDMLDRISENAIAISEVERTLNNLKARQKQLKQELIYWYNHNF
jgi:deoxyadenosine/deoxycytidine kinase